MIKSWASLEWYLPPDAESFPAFHHVSTQVRDDGSISGFQSGDTVWVAQHDQWCAGLAWEWSEVKTGIVMLTDPNSIITNLEFVDNEGNPVLGLLKTIAVNRLVHALPWQAAVCGAMQPHLPRPELAAVAAAVHMPQSESMARHSTAGPIRYLGHDQEQSATATTPPLRAVSATARHNRTDTARRTGSRVADREAGIDSLMPPQHLRRAA